MELFCACRCPHDEQADWDENQDMAECHICKEWFHRICEKISDVVFENSEKNGCAAHVNDCYFFNNKTHQLFISHFFPIQIPSGQIPVQSQQNNVRATFA